MNDAPALALLALILAILTGAVWSVWRHRIVEDLHAIRTRLDERAGWEHEVADALRELVESTRDLHDELYPDS